MPLAGVTSARRCPGVALFAHLEIDGGDTAVTGRADDQSVELAVHDIQVRRADSAAGRECPGAGDLRSFLTLVARQSGSAAVAGSRPVRRQLVAAPPTGVTAALPGCTAGRPHDSAHEVVLDFARRAVIGEVVLLEGDFVLLQLRHGLVQLRFLLDDR